MAGAARLGAGEPANVQLVDHRLVQAAAQVAVALPVELGPSTTTHLGAGRRRLRRQEIARQGLRIRVDQLGTAVEAQPLVRLERAVG